MQNGQMINNQYSRSVARAQVAGALDALAANLQAALFKLPLPVPIANTGLLIEGDGTKHGLSVKAHGMVIIGRFDHVWLADDKEIKGLGGRIQFFRQGKDGSDGESLYQLLFDSHGNARLGMEKSFFDSIRPGSETFAETHGKLALGLIEAIHSNLDAIESSL